MFKPELVFISNALSQEEVFKEISIILKNKGLVTENFLDNIMEREKNYPTGINMEVVNPTIPNIAIPHTETQYVKDCAIVPVKLNNTITFCNMINPNEQIDVSYLFMILNNDPHNQANMLASIMDFMVNTNPTELSSFFEETDSKKIYAFLTKTFK
ncbi:PTS sugar transporter subunit IIA [Vagococcus lutrae]|uniref:PTS sugar transporter subunit IIA n=1 Tax=Vagococcus lutrae TaxID=81947 RepID=A0AAE9XLG0_9ENTE|nr:PTS sugar transporter subunit IIA [Vagococcus lutrae]WCG22900.1 PTS sugar transporter subunit IIA [Vagococcus lutrae]